MSVLTNLVDLAYVIADLLKVPTDLAIPLTKWFGNCVFYIVQLFVPTKQWVKTVHSSELHLAVYLFFVAFVLLLSVAGLAYCAGNPCTGGSCTNVGDSYNCTCLPGCSGINCEIGLFCLLSNTRTS